MLKQPQVIFLDAVGTLFGVNQTVGDVYKELASKQGVIVDAQRLNQSFFNAFTAAPAMAFPDATVEQIPTLEYQWWEAIAVETFKAVDALEQFSDFSRFFAQLYEHFATAQPWFVYPDVKPMLRQWQNQGIELGVLSNFDSRLFPVLEALNLASFFTSITISTAVGVAKPAPEIFYAALNKHDCKPAAALHIGDSVTADYHGAKNVGIPVVIVNREQDEVLCSQLSQPELESCLSLKNLKWC